MIDRAIIVENDGYTMRYEPLDDGWRWKLAITIPADPNVAGSQERPVAFAHEYTTADVLYQVSLVALNHEPTAEEATHVSTEHPEGPLQGP